MVLNDVKMPSQNVKKTLNFVATSQNMQKEKKAYIEK